MEKNYFHMLGINEDFDIDLQELDSNLFRLQLRYHPDRVMNEDASIQHAAQEKSASVNQAYKILKTPLTRAEHLLQLHGVNIDNEPVSNQLLLESLDWREELESTSNTTSLLSILHTIEQKEAIAYRSLKEFFAKSLYSQALSVYIELKFYTRFKQEIIKKIDTINEAI